MPSDKRIRQRAGRRSMEQHRRAQLQRRRRQRFWAIVGSGVAVVVVAAVLISVFSGGKPKANACAGFPNTNGTSPRRTHFSSAPPMCIDPSRHYTAKIVTDVGPITVNLLAKDNPTTVNNFVFLADYHFYDGTVFHRVCTGFVDQGGDPTGTGKGNPGYSFNGGVPKSSSVYTAGALAMANSGAPSSDGSQFFIVVGNTGPQTLSANYSYFGQVTGGMSVVNKVNADGSSAATNPSCPPKVKHRIVKVSISES